MTSEASGGCFYAGDCSCNCCDPRGRKHCRVHSNGCHLNCAKYRKLCLARPEGHPGSKHRCKHCGDSFG